MYILVHRLPLICISYLCSIFLLQIAFAQNETKNYTLASNEETLRSGLNKLYPYYNFYKQGALSDWVEVEVANTAYQTVWLESRYIAVYSNGFSTGKLSEPTKKTNGNEYYAFLYRAYIVHKPDVNGNKKIQVVLFFSHYNIGNKGEGKKPSFVKEVAADLDKNPIIWAEADSEKFVEVYAYSNSTLNGLQKAYATTTYEYDVKTLRPYKKPVITGKRYEFRMHLLARECYEQSAETKQSKDGVPTSITSFFLREGGHVYGVSLTEQLNATQQPAIVSFDSYILMPTGVDINTGNTRPPVRVTNFSFGMDIAKDSVFFRTDFFRPRSLEKWKETVDLKPDVLKGIANNTGSEVIEDKELLKEFLLNFKKLNAYIIIDEEDQVYEAAQQKKFPKKYLYKGTYKNSIPHGWGLLYATNTWDEEYYLGHFTEGKPDGFGIRHNFKLDRATALFTKGMHAGNRLIYGIMGIVAERNGIEYGKFEEDTLSGNGLRIFYSDGYHFTGSGVISSGYFQNGKLEGEAIVMTSGRVNVGTYKEGNFVSGDVYKDKMSDWNYVPGKVILYQGRRYVIMKKENNLFYLDDGSTIASNASFTLTGESSEQKQVCNICNGKGYFTQTTTNTYAGSTTTQKSYVTGPTGYVTWEKTTTTTTAPTTITSTKTTKCHCFGGYLISKPVPLKANQR